MKSQLGNSIVITRVLILLAGLLAGAAGCSKKSTTADASAAAAAVQNNSTVTTNTATGTTCTGTVTATIVASSMTNSQVNASADVVWLVTATGCPSFNLIRKDGSPNTAFTSTISYTTRYTQIGAGIHEYVDIQGLTSSGTVAQTTSISSAAFSVLPSGSVSGTLSCTAVANPTLINVRIDSAGTVIDTSIPIYFTVLLNKPGIISSITDSNASNSSATFSIASGVPSASSALTQQAAATNFKPGLNTFTITVNDPTITGTGSTATCLAALQVNSVQITGTPLPTVPPVVVGPPTPAPAPTCTLTASQTSAKPGDQITLSLNGSGAVNYGDIEGYAVSPAGGQVYHYATTTRTFSGHVYGPGGLGSCQATVTVNDVEVGFNFEDYKDGDYNDSVVCASGGFQVVGKQIFSVKTQTVTLKTYKHSACDHQVELQIIDDYGTLREQHNYLSSQAPTFDVTFGRGWQISVLYHSLGSCSNSSGWIGADSSYVQVGYYCRKTGN